METIKRWFQKKTSTEVKNASEAPAAEALTGLDLRRLKPYGDQVNDGAMQLSFTLPVDANSKAKEAARLYLEKLGLEEVHVSTMESVGPGFAFFVAFARSPLTLDFTKVQVAEAAFQKMTFEEIEDFVHEKIGRPLVVVGATTGSDAHTVGIDAIMNMKGYNGDYGLERYNCFQAYNLRSQVDNAELVKKAASLQADAILVSKIVTQRGKHIEDLKELSELLAQEKKLGKNLIKIVGGPRMTHAQATKIGYDAGFGPGTRPSEVASFIVQEFVKHQSS